MNIDQDKLPTTLDEAVDMLMAGIDDEDREAIDRIFREENPTQTFEVNGVEYKIPLSMHHGFGTYIRNNWNLWEDSPLSRWFIRELKIAHADDMWGIIQEAWQARYLGKPFNPAESVERYRKHWEQHYGENALEQLIDQWKENHKVETI